MKKKTVMYLTGILLAVIVVASCIFSSNVLVGGKLYPRDIQSLDLRGQTLTIEEYEQLRAKLPDCAVQWDVPLSTGTYPEDTRVLTLTSLTDEDVAAISYFTSLETVEAEGCTDYPQLQQLKRQYPELEVRYTVTVGGEKYPLDTDILVLESLADEDLDAIGYLPELEIVHAGQCEAAQVEKLRSAYPDLTVVTAVNIAGRELDLETTSLEADSVTYEDAQQLKYLPKLEQVHITNPDMEAQELLDLREELPNAEVTWEVDVNGMTFRSDITEVEFTQLDTSLAKIKGELEYLPDLEKVFLNQCGVDNETMAAWREEKRGEYKVVWTIQCGEMLVRTDDTYFMPRKFELKTGDESIVDLHYCEDMICIDIGHSQSVTHCEWAAHMPNLKYLILAETGVRDLTPLSGLKNLVFLEIFLSPIHDYTPLLGCTALEDLNLCYTYGDVEPLTRMTWLKRLWIGRISPQAFDYKEVFAEKMPDCEVNMDVIYSTGQGWRDNKNYFDMRDVLGMFYMK